MEKSFDLKVQETKQELVKFIKGTGLPLSVMQMILAEAEVAVNMEWQSGIRKELSVSKEIKK